MTIESEVERGVRPGGYRLPETTRVGAVRLQVSDLARSLDFYVGVLGLRLLSSPPESGVMPGAPGAGRPMAVLGTQDRSTPLVELHERAGARPVPRRGLLGLFHFAILLPDRGALGRFMAHLIDIGVHPGAADHLVSEALYLNDPDGLGIEVYTDRPQSAWRTNGRELAMTTDPLDLVALVRAGDGERWRGMPAGTTIGHVHLSVGTLREAEAFYHSALGFDKTVWSYPGALFLSAGGYHHHLGTNIWAAGSPAATDRDARLLEWELILPSAADVAAAARSAADAGYLAKEAGTDRMLKDPWGTILRLTDKEQS